MSNVLKALARGGAAETDPNFKQTVLLLHGDGTNGAQNNTFLDSSTNNFTITRNGNTTQGTFSPFSLAAGEWSNYFDGTGDGLSVPANAAFDFGSGNFTVEAWVYLAGNSPLDGNSRRIANIFSVSTSSVFNFNFIIFGNSTTTGTGLEIYNGSNIVNVAGTINQNTWNHVAVSKSGTSVYFWLNGTQLGSTQTTSGNWGSSVNGAQVGRTLVPSYTFDLNGYISNVRILKGTALYTATFTPPTTPLTAITNTSLLTCQSNRFVDNSTNNFTITRNGDVRVTPFSPFAPTAAYSAGTNGGSGYFDGTGDYLTAPDNAAFDYGSGAFTIELWVYLNASTSGTNIPFVFQGSSAFSTDSSWAFLRHSSDKLRFISTPDGGITFTITDSTASFLPTTGQWYHLAAVRSGSTVTLYVNGVSVGSGTNSTTFFNSTRNVAIGASSDGAAVINGYISGVKIIKGTATAPSGVPTTPPVNSSGTSLLLNFTNAGIIDNTGKNVLETVGNAQIDTTTKKYGTGSLEFDGNVDYLLGPNSIDFNFGGGDFTIEFWMYASAQALAPICHQTSLASSTGWVVWNYNGTNPATSTRLLTFMANGASFVLTTTSDGYVDNTWTHIAVVKSGTGSNNIKIYSNGTAIGTGTYATALANATQPFYVGGIINGVSWNDTRYFNGYIDDLRITKGVARYTANFTAPTKEFPDL